MAGVRGMRPLAILDPGSCRESSPDGSMGSPWANLASSVEAGVRSRFSICDGAEGVELPAEPKEQAGKQNQQKSVEIEQLTVHGL